MDLEAIPRRALSGCTQANSSQLAFSSSRTTSSLTAEMYHGRKETYGSSKVWVHHGCGFRVGGQRVERSADDTTRRTSSTLVRSRSVQRRETEGQTVQASTRGGGSPNSAGWSSYVGPNYVSMVQIPVQWRIDEARPRRAESGGCIIMHNAGRRADSSMAVSLHGTLTLCGAGPMLADSVRFLGESRLWGAASRQPAGRQQAARQPACKQAT